MRFVFNKKECIEKNGRQGKSRYAVIESALVALTVNLVLFTVITKWCKPDSAGILPILFMITAGVAVSVWELFENKGLSAAILVYAVVMTGWMTRMQKEKLWQNVLLLLCCFLLVMLLYRLLQFRLSRVIIGFCSMGLVAGGWAAKVDLPKVVIAASFFLVLYAVSELIALFYQGNTKFLVVVYAIIAIITIFTPTPEMPYQWGFVYRFLEWSEGLAKAVSEEIQYRFGKAEKSSSLSFLMTGYSDGEMNLFSRMVEADIGQLMLVGDYTRNNLYLKGKVCNEYTGTGWTSDCITDVDYRVDTLMTLYAIFQHTEDLAELNRFMELKEQTVTFKNIKTQSLFYPLKLIVISEDNTLMQGEHLNASQINKRGYSYTYYFFDIDYANEKVIDIMKNSRDVIYDEEAYYRIYTNLEELYHIEMKPLSFAAFCDMAKRAKKEAYQNNGDAGMYVSERVEALAESLSDEEMNAYEACKIFEKYLHGYHYNKAVTSSLDKNILDEFLFEKKEGYCAHYATALAAMLRCEKIPSRVAEGFLVNYKERTDIYEYTVSSSRAHVWTEAYLDGFGWIRLEPTTIFGADADKLWYQKMQADETAEEEEEILPAISHGQGNVEDVQEEIKENDEKRNQSSAYMILTCIFLIGMAAFACLVAIGIHYYKKAVVRKSKNPDVVFLYMLAKLEKNYFVKEDGESFGEYVGRLNTDAQMPENVQESLLQVKCEMEAYWYGGKTVSAQTLNVMKQMNERITGKKAQNN